MAKTNMVKNKEMNAQVYKLRRKVIGLIHEAKALYPNLPRITVRVAENHDRIAGVGAMGGNIIWITEEFVASRGLVFHELCHAVFAQDHVKDCPLMAGDGSSLKLSKAQADKLFLKYAKAFQKRTDK